MPTAQTMEQTGEFHPRSPLAGKTGLQTRSTENIWVKLISAFLPSPVLSDCVILFPSPGSCIAAIAVEQKTRFALCWSWDEWTLRWMAAWSTEEKPTPHAWPRVHRCQHTQQRALLEMMEWERTQKPPARLQHCVPGSHSRPLPASVLNLKSVLSCQNSLVWFLNSFLTCHLLQFPPRQSFICSDLYSELLKMPQYKLAPSVPLPMS